MEIDRERDGEIHLLYEARKRYPEALAKGLLRRVREHRELFYGADDILAAAGFALEDDALLGIALEETSRHDDRAEAAASVLGRSEEHTSELQSLMRISYAVFCLKKKTKYINHTYTI